MYKIVLLALLSFITTENVFAQTFTLKGKVIDATTGNTIDGASVFLSNTSYGTVSNKTGTFEITNITQGKYDLIVSYIGYETYNISIQIPSSTEQLTIKIKEKSKELVEVIVRNYVKDGWKEWGNFFLDNLIGTSALSKECILKNTDAIKFSYSKKDEQLIADATEPLIIENKALGYTIQYQLENFIYKFNQKTLFFAGYPLFIEMEGSKSKQKRWELARADAYEVSVMRFMRSLYRNRLTEDGYELLLLQRNPNLERQRMQAKQKLYYDTIKRKKTIINYETTLQPDSAAYFKKIMAQKDPIEIIHPGLLTGTDIAYGADSITAALYFKQYLIVRFPRRTIPQEYANIIMQGSTQQPVSSVIALTNNTPVYITSSGYFYEAQDLIIEGFWGWWEKMSTLLPYDYMPVIK